VKTKKASSQDGAIALRKTDTLLLTRIDTLATEVPCSNPPKEFE